MRRLFACLPAALIFGSFGSLPAVADFSDDVRRMGDPYRASQAPNRPTPRKQLARATISDADEDYEMSPRVRADDNVRPRSTQPRRAKSARSTQDRHRAAPRVVSEQPRRLRQVHRPRPAPRSLADGRGPRGNVHGVASYYFSGHTTASGARFLPSGMTAAHRTLPFGTRVRVKHLGNGRSVNVVINDRGPFIGGRVIDLSRGAAGVIGMLGQGLARVSVTILGR